MTADLDPALRPEGWAPKRGTRVYLLPRVGAPADEAPPPPGKWWVVDHAPEVGHWWVMPDDGEAKAWSVVQRAGRTRESMPAGWPGLAFPTRRMFPAALVQAPLC